MTNSVSQISFRRCCDTSISSTRVPCCIFHVVITVSTCLEEGHAGTDGQEAEKHNVIKILQKHAKSVFCTNLHEAFLLSLFYRSVFFIQSDNR